MSSDRPWQLPFSAHVELLGSFLQHRDAIVARIQGLLNAEQKSGRYLQGRSALSRPFEDCFFTLPTISVEQARLRGQLQEAHRASGFIPRNMPEVHNDLADPAEMMVRAFNFWRVSSWSGRDSRVRFAAALFNLYMLRCCELLSMRIWDAGPATARERLMLVQGVLDQLWKDSPPDQPVFVRDARWLIPIAQSPTNDGLAPYFEIAEQLAGALLEEDRTEIQRANVLLAAGHLRSQLRHYNMKGSALDDHAVVLKSRRSNALDFALIIQGLVKLLESYEAATQRGDRDGRLTLAGAICQALSADPELFVNRLDLLGPYSMIEHLFITAEDGHAAYTRMGARHVRLLGEYRALLARTSPQLYVDCAHFKPVPGTYSPLGILFGFSSNITEHMAMKTLLRDPPAHFSLEDAFTDGDASSGKLAWVSGWRKLPHVKPEVQKLFEYPQQFAAGMFARIEVALRRCASAEQAQAVRTGRLFIVAGGEGKSDLPLHYILSSDAQIVAAHGAEPCDPLRLLRDRQEGEFAVSYATPGGWVAIAKDFFTDVLGEGRDVRLAGLPRDAAAVLRLMCLDLVQGGDAAR